MLLKQIFVVVIAAATGRTVASSIIHRDQAPLRARDSRLGDGGVSAGGIDIGLGWDVRGSGCATAAGNGSRHRDGTDAAERRAGDD